MRKQEKRFFFNTEILHYLIMIEAGFFTDKKFLRFKTGLDHSWRDITLSDEFRNVFF